MPLYKRVPVPLQAYPLHLKSGEPYYVISYTLEAFSSYEYVACVGRERDLALR